MAPERLSIRQRLLLLLLPPLLLLSALWAAVSYRSVLHFADLAYDRALYDTARTLATQVKRVNGELVLDLSDDEREMLEVDPDDEVFFEAATDRGQRLGGNAHLPGPDGESLQNESTHFYDRRVGDEKLRLVEYRALQRGSTVIVRVGETRRKRSQLATEALLSMVPVLASFIGAVGLAVWWGVGRGFQPLARMREAIASRHRGDLSPLPLHGLPPELREQAHVINDLMARLATVLDTERSFLADATHQLRTPITVLRTQTELALRARDWPALQAQLRHMDQVAQRLTRLANQLLNLSRAESGLVDSADFEIVDMAALLLDLIAAHEPQAHARQQQLAWKLPAEPTTVRGSALMLEQMLANLLDNAIRYTPEGGHLRLSVVASGDWLHLRVLDDGPGIPEAEREAVLRRFHRGSRSTGTGSGLGLAIVQQTVLAHGGRFRLAAGREDGCGLLAEVDLPRSGANVSASSD